MIFSDDNPIGGEDPIAHFFPEGVDKPTPKEIATRMEAIMEANKTDSDDWKSEMMTWDEFVDYAAPEGAEPFQHLRGRVFINNR